jgi:hypothetical protein
VLGPSAVQVIEAGRTEPPVWADRRAAAHGCAGTCGRRPATVRARGRGPRFGRLARRRSGTECSERLRQRAVGWNDDVHEEVPAVRRRRHVFNEQIVSREIEASRKSRPITISHWRVGVPCTSQNWDNSRMRITRGRTVSPFRQRRSGHVARCLLARRRSRRTRDASRRDAYRRRGLVPLLASVCACLVKS